MRGIRQPRCYGCSSTTCIGAKCSGNAYTWVDFEDIQSVCSDCDVDKQIWIFQVFLREYDNEVAHLTSASTVSQPEYDRTTFLNIEFEFDTGNKIYVMEDTKEVRENYNGDGLVSIIRSVPVLGTGLAANRWPDEYKIDLKRFQITCPHPKTTAGVLSGSKLCPYEGQEEAVLVLAPDVTNLPSDTLAGELWTQSETGNVFDYTIRQVYQVFAETLYISLAIPVFQQCDSGIQYEEIYYAGGFNNPDIYTRCSPDCLTKHQNDPGTPCDTKMKDGNMVDVMYDPDGCQNTFQIA